MVRMAAQSGYIRVSIVPIGEVGKEVLMPLRDGLEAVLDLEVRQDRDQYISTALLGVADVDLYARSLRFVFGEADPPPSGG